MRVRKAYLTRNSKILLLLRPCPLGASYGQEGRMIECSREILSRYLLSACNSVVVSVVELNPSLTVTLTFANVVR